MYSSLHILRSCVQVRYICNLLCKCVSVCLCVCAYVCLFTVGACVDRMYMYIYIYK